MTPSAEPTPLHIIMESAGGGGLSDALLGSLLGAGLTGGLGLLVMLINNWKQDKRHGAELAEKRESRVYEARLELGKKLSASIRTYKNQTNPYTLSFVEYGTSAEDEHALAQLRATLNEVHGDLDLLFSSDIQTLIAQITQKIDSIKKTKQTIERCSALADKELTNLNAEGAELSQSDIPFETTRLKEYEKELLGYLENLISKLRGELNIDEKTHNMAIKELLSIDNAGLHLLGTK